MEERIVDSIAARREQAVVRLEKLRAGLARVAPDRPEARAYRQGIAALESLIAEFDALAKELQRAGRRP